MRPAMSRLTSDARLEATDDFWQGARAGMIPLALLIAIVALTLGGVALARVLAIPSGFFAVQWITVSVWVGGLLIATIVYVGATVRALRQASGWRDAGLERRSVGAWWALGVAALLTLLPVILALALPQHPAS